MISKIFEKLTGKLPLYVIDIGHTPSKSGAMNKHTGVSENEFNNKLASRIFEIYSTKKCFINKQLINIRDIIDLSIVDKEDSLTNLPKDINKMKPKLVVSLHCNAFNEKASGSEILIKEGSSQKLHTFCDKLLIDIFKILKLKPRGVLEIGSDDRGGYLLYTLESPCILLEPFFIDNDNDLDVALDKFNYLAIQILESIIEFEIEKETSVV